jgi:uncharacterized protein with HEPN domain
MDNVKNDEYYIKKILVDLKFLIAHTQTITSENINENEVLLDSIMFRLVQISENSQKLSDDFKKYYRQIPWSAIKGLRNRIVHDYGEVDLGIIYDTVKFDVPKLYDNLKGFE